MRNRILLSILLPAVAVGMISALLGVKILAPPITKLIQKRTEASLQLLTGLGLEKCEISFNYLMNLRLENDPSMVKALKSETLSEIQALGDNFKKIHLLILDSQGQAVSMTAQSNPLPVMSVDQIDISGTIVKRLILGRKAHTAALYFPFWHWYVIGYIFEDDYTAPVDMVSWIIFGGTFTVLLAVMFTAVMTFYFRVNQPLHRIIQAAEKIAEGDMLKVSPVGKDEIGRVTSAFNTMVEGLQTNQNKIDDIMSALRESEKMYRGITQNSLSIIVLVHKRRVIFANQRAYELSGYVASEVNQRPALDFIHPQDRKAVLKMARQQILHRSRVSPIECRCLTKSGTIRWLELSIAKTSYKGKSVLLIHAVDVSERKAAREEQRRLETQLWQAQKMKAIGTLAGGIAHDFNNLLMGIQGSASLLLLDVPPHHGFYEHLKNIERYVKAGAELTAQLLGYARGGKYEVQPISIRELVRRSVLLFGRTKREISIHLDLAPQSDVVEADRSQIEQALLNLLVNAWQAMPGGGELIVKTASVHLDTGAMNTFPEKGGEYVCITITDTGVGMDKETVQKIFDPFFTTKKRERGTGLGLASAYGIIKNHDGGIFCKSTLGKGTTFTIYLPKSDKLPQAKPVLQDVYKTGSETILLVDDEEMVLKVGYDILNQLGYQVFSADNGQKAVEIFKAQADQLDLVILDVIMPRMSGKQVFNEIKRIRPDVPVLLCSGYSQENTDSEFLVSNSQGFLQKPFRLDLLSRKVRKILDQHNK